MKKLFFILLGSSFLNLWAQATESEPVFPNIQEVYQLNFPYLVVEKLEETHSSVYLEMIGETEAITISCGKNEEDTITIKNYRISDTSVKVFAGRDFYCYGSKKLVKDLVATKYGENGVGIITYGMEVSFSITVSNIMFSDSTQLERIISDAKIEFTQASTMNHFEWINYSATQWIEN